MPCDVNYHSVYFIDLRWMSTSQASAQFLWNTESFLKGNPEYLPLLYKYFYIRHLYAFFFIYFQTNDSSFGYKSRKQFLTSPFFAVFHHINIWLCIKCTSEEGIPSYNIDGICLKATQRFLSFPHIWSSQWPDGGRDTTRRFTRALP